MIDHPFHTDGTYCEEADTTRTCPQHHIYRPLTVDN